MFVHALMKKVNERSEYNGKWVKNGLWNDEMIDNGKDGAKNITTKIFDAQNQRQNKLKIKQIEIFDHL